MTRNDSFGRTCKASIGRTGGAAKTAGQPAIPDRTGPSGRRLIQYKSAMVKEKRHSDRLVAKESTIKNKA